MIQDFLFRAMLIHRLNFTQLGQLQALESDRGYCLPVSNVCHLFGIQTNKDQFRIPLDDASAQRIHNERIELELKRENIIKPLHYACAFEPTHVHPFDRLVFGNHHKIMWKFISATKKRRRTSEILEIAENM